MNQNISTLYSIARKEHRSIIGLMSGTSLDGLDIALCFFTGSGLGTQVVVKSFHTVPYPEKVKAEIRKVFAKPTIDFQQLCLLNPWIGNLHGEMILDFLNKIGLRATEVDVVASHGQTVFHAPQIQHKLKDWPNATLQIGDGDHLAIKTGIITLSDFRQKHCAAGGEGAPLALYGDYLLFSKQGHDRILLNMGGISNFTYLAANRDPNLAFATDCGPGNTLLDAVCRRDLNVDFDQDARVAQSGTVHGALLQTLMQSFFISAPIPKTTGPEVFNLEFLAACQKQSGTVDISTADLLATLCMFTAQCIVETIKQANLMGVSEMFSSGGGSRNPLIMSNLQSLLPHAKMRFIDELGVSAAAKEAVLFATLANEALAGGRTNFGERKGVPTISMGKVSFPF